MCRKSSGRSERCRNFFVRLSSFVVLQSACQALSHSRLQTQESRAGARHSAQERCPSQYLAAWPPNSELPICSSQQMKAQTYLAGEWVRLPEKCRVLNMEQLYEHTYEYRQECANPKYDCGIGTDGCYDRLLRIAQWVWQPSECRLMPFDAVKLSQKLAGKRVHFMGDSTMRQQFWSFGSLMEKAGTISQNTKWMMRFTTEHDATFSVDGLEFLTGHRSDPADMTFNSTADSDWIDEAASADYLIFNTGFHHHRRDMEYHHYHSMVRAVMATLRERFTGSRIFFSTTRTAHEYCALNPIPLASYRGSNGTYHWAAPIQNEYKWLQEADALQMSNFHVLNNSMDHLRGDSHVTWQKKLDGVVFDDCLHQCYPGIPDYFNWLSMHALIQAASDDAAAERL